MVLGIPFYHSLTDAWRLIGRTRLGALCKCELSSKLNSLKYLSLSILRSINFCGLSTPFVPTRKFMYRSRFATVPGYATLKASFPQYRIESRISPAYLKIDTRLVTYTYQPFGLNKEYNAPDIAARMERSSYYRSAQGRFKRQKEQWDRRQTINGTPREVLDIEARTLLAKLKNESTTQMQDEEATNEEPTRDRKSQLTRPEVQNRLELELEIQELSSTGEGLAYTPDKSFEFIYIVPFSVPGDKVMVKTYPQNPESPLWKKVDFVKLLSPSPSREGATPKCPHFGICSGCQLQMLPYESQLAHKKTIVEKAFKHFSNLDPSLVPPVDGTIGSPLQYGYRTKLTPHYDGCSKSKPWMLGDKVPSFGFTKKNQSYVLDIEQCPIGTEIVNEGLKIERDNVAQTFWQRKTGKTVLLRESTKREILSESKGSQHSGQNSVQMAALDILKEVEDDLDGRETDRSEYREQAKPSSQPDLPETITSVPLRYTGIPETTKLIFPTPTTPEIAYTYPSLNFRDIKTYTSDNQAFSTEHIGPYTFRTRANSFFQNNNSILPTFLSYIKENLFATNESAGSANGSANAATSIGDRGSEKIKYLLDAYCGSGLFSIALASEFSSVLGIDIDALSIDCARENAKINSSDPGRQNRGPKRANLGFIAADAGAIFTDVPYPSHQTLCVIDPPRKGASIDFLKQLCKYGPKRVLYVSCNVHTQARDVGILVQGFDESSGSTNGGRDGRPKATREKVGTKGVKGWKYEIEKIGSFDFFPQTGHVEGVCFLNRVEED